MKRTLLFCLTLVLLLALVLTGCSKEAVFLGNQTGTVGVDEELCDLFVGQLNMYINGTLEGAFAFARKTDETMNVTEEGEGTETVPEPDWTICTAEGEYIALSNEDGSVVRRPEPFPWHFEDGAFSVSLDNRTVYLGSGLTTVTDKPDTTFTIPMEPEPTPEPTPDPTPDPAEGMAASVEMNDTTTYYPTFGEAWSAANAADVSTFVVVNLLDDVTAVDGRFGDYGALTTVNRTGWIVLNLGGHTLGRGLTSATDNGEVFRLDASGYMTIKNGTITGGNSKDNGGCFYVGGVTELVLESLTITGNHSDENGSALYLAADDAKVTLDNVTVTGNTADDSGAVFWAIDGMSRSSLVFENKVEISGNSGDGGLNNLVYDGHGWCGWLNTDKMGTDSKIGVSYFDGYGGPLADSFGSRLEELRSCFFADQGNHDITSGDGTLVVKFKNDVAAAIHNGEWDLYSTFAQAWASADGYMQSSNATMLLFGDWVANSNGSFDDDGGYGDNCYFFIGGALYPRDRDEDTWLNIDLNGYTINRGLYDPDKGINKSKNKGCIFYMDEDSDDVNIHIMNGTLTGGNNTGDGGAIYSTNNGGTSGADNIVLTNVLITKNKSGGKGGGIYDGQGRLTVKDSTVTNNTCSGRGGGICVNWVYTTLEGKVNITGNNSTGRAKDNVYLAQNNYVMDAMKLDYKNSKIGTAKDWTGSNHFGDRYYIATVNRNDSVIYPDGKVKSTILDAITNDDGESYTICLNLTGSKYVVSYDK